MPISERVSLIVNTGSGSQDLDDVLAQVFEVFTGEPPLARFVDDGASVLGLAREEVADGSTLVVAIGGDGTVSQVAAAVAGTAARLGVIPVGTANAFARAMDIPLGVKEASAVLRSGSARRIDLGYCGTEPLLLLGAIGYEAEVIEHATRERKEWLGAFAYLYTGLELLTDHKPFDVTIRSENRTFRTIANAVTVANVAPATSPLAQGLGSVIPDDGLFEVTIFAPTSPGDAFARLVELFGAAALDLRIWRDDVIAFRTASLQVETEPAQKLALDGEVLRVAAPVFSLRPRHLQVVVPSADPPGRKRAINSDSDDLPG